MEATVLGYLIIPAVSAVSQNNVPSLHRQGFLFCPPAAYQKYH